MTANSLEPNDFLKVLDEIKRLLELDARLKPLIKFYINKGNADEIETKTQEATTELPVQSEGLVFGGATNESNPSSEVFPGASA